MAELSQFHLVIRPKSKDGVEIDALQVTITFQTRELQAGSTLVSLDRQDGFTPHQDYSSDRIFASDKNGAIPLYREVSESRGSWNWIVDRPIHGEVSVQVLALARRVEDVRSSGPRCDIIPEKGGLQGNGCSFIPLPPFLNQASQDCVITLEWDMSEISNRVTRTVWTFGEGPHAIVVEGGLEDYISNTHFMVGNIQSYPGKPLESDFGFYWLGDIPNKFKELGPINESLFKAMCGLFEPNVDGTRPYRVFLRRSVLPQAFGGTAVNRSYILEYGEETEKTVSKNELLFLLSHEMVHNWLHLSSEEDGMENHWFNEGERPLMPLK
jgi:hypothetical protein